MIALLVVEDAPLVGTLVGTLVAGEPRRGGVDAFELSVPPKGPRHGVHLTAIGALIILLHGFPYTVQNDAALRASDPLSDINQGPRHGL